MNARIGFTPLLAFFVIGLIAIGNPPARAGEGEPPRPAERAMGERAPAAPLTDAEMAQREMKIGVYYVDRDNYIGAINRFKIVVTRYQSSPQVDEALFRLVECYLTLGIAAEAQASAAVLDRKFPDSRWRSKALDLLKARRLEPAEQEESWISRAFK